MTKPPKTLGQTISAAFQAKSYHDFQTELIEGALEGCKHEELNAKIGGLGLDKTKQVIEERALCGKCGNFACTERTRVDVANFQHRDSVKILSNGEVAKAVDYINYCSEDCYQFFTSQILRKRPAADVWELHQKMRSNQKRESGEEEKKLSSSSMIGTIKEKTKVRKPKQSFNVAPEPDLSLKANKRIVKDSPKEGDTGQEQKAKSKNVSFSNVTEVTEIPSRQQEQADIDYHDENDSASSTDENDTEDEDVEQVASFFDSSLVLDKEIENSGLSPFATVWDFLTRVVTIGTKQAIYEESFKEWKSTEPMFDDVLASRKTELEKCLADGVDACNFTYSEEFSEKANTEMQRIVKTLDLSRGIPKFNIEHWALLSCILLSCLDESGRLPGYDFATNEIVRCFPTKRLSDLGPSELDILKNTVRNPFVPI